MTANGKQFAGAAFDDKAIEGMDRLGWLVWYEIGDVTQKTYEQARKILEKHNLDADLFPKPGERKSYHEALVHLRDMRKDSPMRILVRPVIETASYVRHQITVEERVEGAKDEQEMLDYRRELFTVFDKSKNVVTFEKEGGGRMNDADKALRDRLTKHFDHFMKHIREREVRFYISYQKDKWAAIAARSRGGMWFVPDTFTEQIKSLEAAFIDFGGGSKFYKTPILDTENWRTDIAAIADRVLMQDMTELEGQLDKLLSDAQENNKGEIRAKVIQTKIDNALSLASRASLYEKACNYVAKDIRDFSDRIVDKAETILRGKAKGLTIAVSKTEQARVDRETRKAARALAKEEKAKEAAAAKTAKAEAAAAKKDDAKASDKAVGDESGPAVGTTETKKKPAKKATAKKAVAKKATALPPAARKRAAKNAAAKKAEASKPRGRKATPATKPAGKGAPSF